MTAPTPAPDLTNQVCQLDQTLVLLGARLQRVLTAVAMTLDARRAVNERLAFVTGHASAEREEVAMFERHAARCREIAKSLESM